MTHNILAVDDEPHILTLIERVLSEKTPYGITVTHNALEVPDILSAREFDVIVTDLRMPGLDGMELLRLVHDKKRLEEVIIITAFPSLDTALEAFFLGASDYIAKPFRWERLIDAVDTAVRRRREHRHAARLEAMLACEPFDRALAEFKTEYVKSLHRHTGGDAEATVRRSGLPIGEINSLLAGNK